MGGQTNGRYVAMYARVSSGRQDTRSQLPDLEKWAAAQDDTVKRFQDKATGTKMDRPGWNKLEKDIRLGRVKSIVVWRLDRLGRTAAGLCTLFAELQERKVNLISLKDGLDLNTPAGRLMANVLASVAQFESEVRGERVRAGQAVAKANGKTWGGSKPGVRKQVTPVQIKMIHRMRIENESIKDIAEAVGLSRPTIYDVLRDIPWTTEVPK